MTASAAITRIRLSGVLRGGGCGARATVLRLVTYDLELARGWDVVAAQQGGLLMEAIGDQDCTRRASAYAKLAEEPGNLDFREQYLHLAREWMDLALEQALPRE